MIHNFLAQVFEISSFRRTLSVAAITTFVVIAAGFSQQEPSAQSATETKSTDTPTTFEVDDVHSMALFRVQHMGAGRFWGLFNDVSGSIQYTPENSLSLNIANDFIDALVSLCHNCDSPHKF